MASDTTFSVPKAAQAGLVEFYKSSCNMLNQQFNVRENMRQIDLQYAREMDQTVANKKAIAALKYGDADKVRNLTIPVVLPAVESAVVYQTSVFLTGSPLFDIVSSPQYQDAAIQLSAVFEENSIRGGWVRELQMFLRDGFKYNISAIEVDWSREKTYSVNTNGQTQKPELKEVIWEGNCLHRWDPYNTIWDTRVPLTEMRTRGEFAGRTQLFSRTALKAFLESLDGALKDNFKAAYESQYGAGAGTMSAMGTYYIPPVNIKALTNITPMLSTNWMAWASASGAYEGGPKIDYKNLFELTTLYARIIPADFNLSVPAKNTPQIWKLYFVNQQVLVYAERMTNAHNSIPVLFGQPLEDGLSYQTKSLAENVTPIQEVSSALMNSVLAARRRSISDRGLYDPSRVGEAQINSTNPSAKIPVKPAAYGKPLSEAYYPIPFEDRNSTQILQELGPIIKLSDIITGQNPARQGQFVKGNKTQTEYSDVMNHSNGRDQTTSLLLEAQVFTPLKEILKINTLQYQGAKSIFYRTEQRVVDIDPVVLRNAVLEFKVSDGLTPTSKLISSDSFQTALQVIGSSPQIAAEYNIGPMFSYLMKTQSAAIADFEKSKEQVAFERAMNQWMQLAQMAMQAKQPFNVPQPLPEQYGYLVNGQLNQTNPKPQNPIGDMITQISQANQQNA